jgi:hypothetical protein
MEACADIVKNGCDIQLGLLDRGYLLFSVTFSADHSAARDRGYHKNKGARNPRQRRANAELVAQDASRAGVEGALSRFPLDILSLLI